MRLRNETKAEEADLKRKHIIAFLCALLLLPLTAIGAAAEGGDCADSSPLCLPILMYHEVKPYKARKDSILPSEFESDLIWLAENGYTAVTVEDLLSYVRWGVSLPEKPIVLSFDDGYLNNYVYVFPLLKKYHTRIVFSVIGKNTDDFSRIPSDNPDYSHVTWDQLREMVDSGLVEVQNHTYDLHGKTGCKKLWGESDAEYERTVTEDLQKLQYLVAFVTGRPPTAFAYPLGAYSDQLNGILKKIGFQVTLTCDYGVNVLTGNPDDLFCLKRVCRPHGKGAGKVLGEAYKTLKYDKRYRKELERLRGFPCIR